MTAQLYLVAPGALGGSGPGSVVELTGDEARHAATVKRIRVGEVILVADGTGVLAEGVVGSVIVAGADARRGSAREPREGRAGPVVEVRIASISAARVAGPRFVLVQALAKGGRDELAVETATELGVDEIVPWQASRCIVTWRGPRGERALEKWQATARAAAKQSRRAVVPGVAAAETTPGLVARARASALTLVLHEDATLPLPEADIPAAGDVLLVVGPEGGIDPAELAALTTAGAVAVRLGDEVLRSSTAGPAALAALCARTRWARPSEPPANR